MDKCKTIFVTLALLFFAVVVRPQSEPAYSTFVKGRIVDNSGREVHRASLTAIHSSGSEENLCSFAHPYPFVDSRGSFIIEELCDVPEREITVFAKAIGPFADAQYPIRAPYWDQLRKIEPRFAGRSLKLNGNGIIDVGEIPVQVWFNLVEVFVLDKSGKAFYKNEDEWSNFVMIVRHPNGTAVGETGLSISDVENNVRVDRGSVRVALPEGTWTLELLRSLDDFDQSGRTLHRLAKTTVTVAKTDVCLQAKFVVDRNALSKG
jgi:hypothetical protein